MHPFYPAQAELRSQQHHSTMLRVKERSNLAHEIQEQRYAKALEGLENGTNKTLGEAAVSNQLSKSKLGTLEKWTAVLHPYIGGSLIITRFTSIRPSTVASLIITRFAQLGRPHALFHGAVDPLMHTQTTCINRTHSHTPTCINRTHTHICA